MSTNELTKKIRELKELQALIEQAQAEAEAIKDDLKAYMIDNDTDEMNVDVFKIRYAIVKGSRFDTAAFKKTHADLYAQYTRQTETRRFTVA
jgi:predicted phage-related endonuclease